MRVLSIYWGLAFGGVAQYAVNLQRLCGRVPLQLRSLCILPEGRDVDQRVLDSLDSIVIRVSSVFDLSWVPKVRKVVQEENLDCVLSHGFNGHLVSLVSTMRMQPPIRRLASYHGSYHPNTPIRRLLAPFYDGFTNWFLAKKANAIVSVAECCVTALIGHGVPASKFTVIHNGIPDLTHESNNRDAIRQEWGFDETHLLIGVASRLVKIKGVDALIKSFAQAERKQKNMRLVIIGDGSQRESLQQLAITLGVESAVTFVGIRNDIPDCLSALDVFALPSLSEAHSIGLLEAMRAGKAIVATDVGGNTETVRDKEEALIVNAGDCNGLSAALSRLANDAQLRDRLGDAAYKRFHEKFMEDAMLEKTASWLMQVCCG